MSRQRVQPSHVTFPTWDTFRDCDPEARVAARRDVHGGAEEEPEPAAARRAPAEKAAAKKEAPARKKAPAGKKAPAKEASAKKTQAEIEAANMTMGEVAMMTLVRPFLLGF